MSISQTTSAPNVVLRGLPLTAVQWTSGFWADRARDCVSTMVPVMGRLMQGEERVKFIGNFEVATGMVEGRHRGPRWNDGDFYKWLEAACATLVASPDAALSKQIDSLVELIAKTQREDGYIHTDVQIRQRAGEAVEPFGNPLDFEMYNMGHLMSAGVMHHRATGKTTLLNIARKSADFLDKVFAKPTVAQARHGICPSHLMGLIELYRETKEPRYRDLAKRLLEMRDLVTNGDDDNLDRIPFKQHTFAHGHAVRATYLYAGAADVFAETGDKAIFKPLPLVWDDLTSKKLYITGGCGALFDGASPDGAEDQKNITRTHQSFGRNYQLPSSTAHNETCAAIGNLMWNWRMLQITGDVKYADLVEHTFYNSVLAGMSLDGTAFFYTNTLRKLNPMPVPLRWSRQRQKVLGCFCCPPNVVRTIAELSHYAYLTSDDGVSVVLYGGNSLDTKLPDGTRIALKQATNYPWDGRIKITVESAGEYSISLRIPAWAENATLRLNGNHVAVSSAAHFAKVARTWSIGDIIELHLPMPVRLMEAHPLVEEALNQLAVERGPIVYCLESSDLPQDVKVLDIRLSRSAALHAESGNRPLDQLTVLKGHAIACEPSAWEGSLYRTASPQQTRQVEITLLPYFAWGNRGGSEMTVWIPAID